MYNDPKVYHCCPISSYLFKLWLVYMMVRVVWKFDIFELGLTSKTLICIFLLKKEVGYDNCVLSCIAVLALIGNVSLFMKSFSSPNYVTSNVTVIS